MANIFKKQIVVQDPETGERVKARSKKWWGRYRDAEGRDRRVPLAFDRTAAQALLNQFVRDAEREKAGLIEPSDKHLNRPIAEHLEDYRKHLLAKTNASRYVEHTMARLQAILAGCKVKRIRGLSASSVANWLRIKRDENAFGISTSNDYLTSIKAFGNWLVRDDRIPKNPLAHLQRLNVDVDIRRKRRVLSPDELSRLIRAAETSRRGSALKRGLDRAMIYRLAAFTGLRAQEVASLTARSFQLEVHPHTVTVQACYSKHRRNDVLPLEADLVLHLRAYLQVRVGDKSRGGLDRRLWPGRWYRHAALMLRQDLAAARKAWLLESTDDAERATREQSDYLLPKDHSGRVVDFHSLRHGFITYLVSANVPPKVAQLLARHSTITLTLDHYTHLAIGDLATALKQLPTLQKWW